MVRPLAMRSWDTMFVCDVGFSLTVQLLQSVIGLSVAEFKVCLFFLFDC